MQDNSIKNIAFFVATPFQLLNAFCIWKSAFPDRKADIFVRCCCAYKQLIDAVEMFSPYFNDVFMINDSAFGRSIVKSVFGLAFPDRKTKKALQKNSYSDMFISREGGEADYYYRLLKKKNPSIRFNYYDEGIGEYYLDIGHAHYKRNIVLRLFGYKNPYKVLHRLWLWQPDLRCANRQYLCEKISTPSENIKRQLLGLYNIKSTIHLPDDCRLIYMDQPFLKQQHFDIDDRHMLDIISSVIPKENIYVKVHPGTTDASRYDGYKTLPDLGCSWELAQCVIDTSDIIIVAVNSTAAVTPKTLFDKEPRVMLLFDMFPDKPFMNIENQRRYFSGVKSLYSDTSRFIIPKTTPEITDFLKKETDR